MPAAEAFSFLRETRGISTWTVRDMSKSLNMTPADAKEAIAILELQGYVKPAGKDEWMTTLSGEDVSASKPPRYRRERVEEALALLSKRISENNRERDPAYTIVAAVAFGDFLSDRPRVQPAEVGIQLAGPSPPDADSATERKAQRAFLKRLPGRGPLVHLVPYEQWMSARSHRKLL